MAELTYELRRQSGGSGGGGDANITGPLGSRPAAQSVSVALPTDQAPVPVTGPLTDAQLRASALELPTGASTEATLAKLVPENGDYQPGYDRTPSGDGKQSVDPSGNLRVRSVVLTDEGTVRVNFANSSLAVAIGTATFTQNTYTVACSLADGLDLHVGDYVKLDADPESAYAQVAKINDAGTLITLKTAYSGTGGPGASSRVLVKPTTGDGGTISVASGAVTLASGTTSGSKTIVCRDVDVAPLVVRGKFSVSQRIANQRVCMGGGEGANDPRWFARFVIDGTTNTTVKTQTGRNPTGAPSAAETEEYTAIIPNGLNTTASLDYRVEILTESCRFYINGVLVKTHTKTIPSQHDEMQCGIVVENTGVPASGTSVVCDYLTAKNHNKVEVGIMSDNEQIAAINPNLEEFNFSQAGVISINAVLLVIDCSRYKSVQVQCTSMGTGGTVVPEFSNDGTTWVTATMYTQAGSSITSFTTAGLWALNTFARYFRLRLSVATTAGTMTLFCNACNIRAATWLATQPVSGTVTVSSTTANIGTSGITAYTDSSSNLAGAATFTGTSRDAGSTIGYNWFAANAFADVAGTLRVEKSTDNSTWRLAESVAVGINEGKSLRVPVTTRYMRAVYINGASAQTVFLLTSAHNRI